MDLALAIVFGLPLLQAMMTRRWPNPRLLGMTYLASGFLLEGVFQALVADWAGRSELGQFAVLEFCFCLAGLGSLGAGLLVWPQTNRSSVASNLWHGFVWGIWVVLVPVTAFMVVNRLPP